MKSDPIREFIDHRTIDPELFDIVRRMARHVWNKIDCQFIEFDDFHQECWLCLLAEKHGAEIEKPTSYFYQAFTHLAYNIKNRRGDKAETRGDVCAEDHQPKPEAKPSRRQDYHQPQSESIKAQARKAGKKYETVQARLNRGWDLQAALTKPEEMNPISPASLRQRAITAGLKPKTVWQRVKVYGWSVDRALQKICSGHSN